MFDQVAEQVACGADDHAVARVQGAVGEIPEDHRLAHAVGAEEDDVGAFGHEIQGEELVDEGTVDLARPRPVEVGEGLEGTNASEVAPMREASAGLLLELDREHFLEPRLATHLVQPREQTEELQPAERRFERFLRRLHRAPPVSR